MSGVDAALAQKAEADMAITEKSQTTEAAPPAAEADAAAAAAPIETKPDAEKAALPTATAGSVWPAIADGSPLQKFIDQSAELVKEAGYDEIWGVKLNTASDFTRNLILQKFLRANANDVDKAAAQLKSTLEWRKDFQPLALPQQTFSREKFGGLAYISTVTGVPESVNKTDVICWNIYGSVTDNKVTFGDLDAFTKWRVAVMEAALANLKLAEATEPIPDYGEGVDPYQMIQVHDYKDISFLRQDPDQKAAASKAIEIFGAHYPETLSRKMFVNVPTIMGWMFSAMKLVLPKETVRKFTVLSNGKYLVGELGDSVPKEYGGNGAELESAEQLKLE